MVLDGHRSTAPHQSVAAKSDYDAHQDPGEAMVIAVVDGIRFRFCGLKLTKSPRLFLDGTGHASLTVRGPDVLATLFDQDTGFPAE
ncbi:MAG: hypothetical protein ACYCV4_19450 [Dermatophilaceae bacterium]